MKNYLFEISVEDKVQFEEVIKKLTILGLQKDKNFFSRKINNPIGKDELRNCVHVVRASADEKIASKFLDVPSVKNLWCLADNIPFE